MQRLANPDITHMMTGMLKVLALGWAALLSISAWAVTIPKKLSQDDRQEVVRLLGLGTSTKQLTNPFPLGGYSGVEVSVSIELIDVRELGKLGCTAGTAGCPNTTQTDDEELRFPRISIGKGLYYNVDGFFHFSPQTDQNELASYGGALRWSFYEAKFLPLNISLWGHANQINFNDDFQALTLGMDLVGGLYVNNFGLYIGAGFARSRGTFLGLPGDDSTVDNTDPKLQAANNSLREELKETHSLLGVTAHFGEFFVAAQVDRYTTPIYSAKLGLRY